MIMKPLTKPVKELTQPYLQGSSNVFSQNKLLKIAVLVIVALKVHDSIQISALKANTQTVVVPGGKPYNYTVGVDSASDIYLLDMANYISMLAGNLNAANADINMTNLIALFHPSTYNKYQEHFKAIAEEIKRYPSVGFYSELVRPEPIFIKENHITIHYKRSRVVGNAVKPPEKRTLSFDFVIENGRFYILEMDDKAYE